MATARSTVRIVDDGFYEWDFNGTIRGTDDGVLVVHPDDLVDCKAVDLLNAFRAQKRAESGDPNAVLISQGPRDGDLHSFSVAPVQFQLGNNELVIQLLHLTEHWEDDEQVLRRQVVTALDPLMKRNGLTFISAGYDPYYSAVVPYHLNIELSVRLRGQNLHAVYTAGEDACALLNAVFDGVAGRSEIADLLRGGHASALIGQYENDWLEAKSQHYDLQSIEGKVSLALAVARFANSSDGGIIVIGLATKSRQDGDEIQCQGPVGTAQGRS
ncbi:hypothetical protein BH09ACT12_BH09ACT12_04970 [soil metagenome]